MSVDTSTAQASVSGHHRGEAAAGLESQQAAFAGRQVSEQPEERRAPSLREGRRAGGEAGAGGETRSVGARVVRAIRSAFRRSVTTVPAPRETPIRALSPEDLMNVPAAEPAEGSAERRINENVTGFGELPWLATDGNAKRREADRALDELRDRPDIPDGARADMEAAAGLVSEFERDLVRANELVERSRTEILSESEWRELSSLRSSNKRSAPACEAWLRDRLGQLAKEDALNSPAGMVLQELHHRLADGQAFLFSNDLRWDDTARRVETTLPVGSGKHVVVESRVVPGTALGARFTQGYPADDSATYHCAASYLHVADLALTTLTGANGETLFSGLRHALLHGTELDLDALRKLSDDDLKTLVDESLVQDGAAEAVGESRARQIDDRCRGIRRFDWVAVESASAMAGEACRTMARETVAAALVADPDKLARALDGETVNLNLFCISLLSENDFDAWCGQVAVFDHLVRTSPVELPVCGLDGAPRSVRADVKVRQTMVSLDPEVRRTVGRPRQEVYRLLGLGPATTVAAAPQGAVQDKVEAMRSRAVELSGDIEVLGEEYLAAAGELGWDHPQAVEAISRRSGLQDEQERLERNAQALEDAGRQLKVAWAERQDWPSGAVVYEKVLPRLALVGYLMGETPVLSCRRGRDFTRLLDPEIKFLATVADSQHGHLPRPDLDMGIWGPARNDFTPQ